MKEATLGRAFREVADALESSDEDSCVAVWPATAEGLVDEFQVLTEKQWRRLLSVGLRLEPGADVRELYCFRDVPADDGLTVRVLRLVQESQTRTLRSGELWKVQKTPTVVRSRVDVEEEIARVKSGQSTGAGTPPRPTSIAASTTISPEEVQRKRRRSAAAEDSGDGTKDTDDEMRPPKKTRRLSGKRKSRRVTVAPIRLPGRHSKYVTKNGDAENSNETISSGLKSESTKSVAGFVPVVDGDESSSSGSEGLSDKSTAESTSSDGEEGEASDPEEESVRISSPVQRTEKSLRLSDGHHAFSSVLKRIAVAGMGNDEDDSGGTQCNSRAQAQTAIRSTGVASLLTPLWSIVEGASNTLSSVLSASTTQDSSDYDLMWVQEGKERWTMFGEPSPRRKGMKTRSQHKSISSNWKFCDGQDKSSDMGGGDVGAVFTAKLKQLGTKLTSEDLLKLYPAKTNTNEGETPLVLEGCKFFDLFDADPVKARKETERLREEARKENGALHLSQILMSTQHHPLKKMQTFDYRLKPREKAKLAANGVVAVERMPGESFADIYYHLYTDDMPVFATSDSVLHAWHRSFDAFLVDVETEILSSTLARVLDSSLLKCHDAIAAASGVSTSVMKAMLDVELFLRVALSLLRGEKVPGSTETTTKLGSLWLCINAEETTQAEIFSTKRDVDFSMFKPRGHYAKSEELRRYFRAMTWLGTIDFRIAGGEDPVEDLHQLHCAVVLVRFLLESRSLEAVENVDALISKLVADGGIGADSLSPSELARLLPSEDKAYADDDIETTSMLEHLQARILEKRQGTQLINGHPRMENLPATSTVPMAPPTSFALLGQRFVWSSFVFSRLVFDQVVHNDEKQTRRIPSAVDVAFTLFGNDSAAKDLVERMDAKPPKCAAFGSTFVPFRDGIPFASNLVALRQTIDQELDDENVNATDESTSISTLWQRALRALSGPSPNAARTFHSHVWQQRQMNTQLGSFTQLRHDTLLYAKQSFTMMCGCEYAAGMVDPYPLFWRRMQELANCMEHTIERELKPLLEFSSRQHESDHSNDFLVRRSQGFFHSFAETMQKIEEIAVCQADKTPLSDAQTIFLKTVMEERFGSGGSRYCGWFPGLFFESREDSGKSDVLVADVHTDSPSSVHRDPGGVLHLGVANPLMGFFVVDNVMYAGPVFSSYEFVTRIDQRLTDAEFERKLPSIRMPEWAYQSYLC